MRRLLLLLLLVCTNTWAAGVSGINFQTYAAGGAQPGYIQDANGNITNRTLLSTGTVSTVNYNWGGNAVLNSGRAEGVIVRFYGFINIETAGTYYFGGNADDGIRIKVNNISVVDSWIESGGNFRSGSITLAAGVYPIELIYYENGGGALVNLQWYTPTNPTWQIVPSTSLATDSTYWVPIAPALCCGGSAAVFSTDPANTNKINSFTDRATADTKVYIEQIGNSNNTTVQQTGTKNNSVTVDTTGSFNSVDITQSGNNSTTANLVDLTLNGNSNNVDVTQTSTGGTKGAFININDSNNTVNILQKDSGSHYLNLNLSGSNKTVDVTQQGSAGHMADINLSGAGSRGINLIQQGTTQQFYSINSTCASNCQAISVTQGQ